MSLSASLTAGPILIIEDEAIVAADIERRLQRMGYATMGPAASAEEALDLVRATKPAVALLDIRLQGEMDGIALANIFRTEMEIAVVFLTAHADKATLDRAQIAESFGYLLKPFDERLLEITIGMAIYRHNAEQERKRLTRDLMEALENIKVLSGLLSTCCCCTKIEDDTGKWVRIEQYISQHSDAEFSHTYCPECLRKQFPEIADKVLRNAGKSPN